MSVNQLVVILHLQMRVLLTYQGKLLILTENNVNIPMDLRAGTPDDALIILTSKAVNIGKPKSGSTTFGTDTIDAFII